MGATAIFTALAVGGKLLGGIGELQQGRAEGRAADFNAKIADQQARIERENAAAEASDYRRSERRTVAGARAARGASGVTGAGSPLLVEEATVREIALGSSRIKHGGELRGLRLNQEAELYRMRGKSARRSSYLRAGSSLLSAGSAWAENA